mmetsp:Transcript_22849/g.40982  ORF Transcript_22849/g.40982 Transcript_22849/m.40982 type:complete len:94 (-) Transcript_22849:16-297(-)
MANGIIDEEEGCNNGDNVAGGSVFLLRDWEDGMMIGDEMNVPGILAPWKVLAMVGAAAAAAISNSIHVLAAMVEGWHRDGGMVGWRWRGRRNK